MEHNETPMTGNIQKINENLSSTLSLFAENMKLYAISFRQFQENLDWLRLVRDRVASISSICQTADQMAENQFVLLTRLPQELIDRSGNENIDALIRELLLSDDQVERTISRCGLQDHRVFRQAIDAFHNGSYDLAILGLTAVLDLVLSEHSRQIKNVNINSRCKAITKKLEDKGDLFLDELEGQDFLLFLTYPKAVELFGESTEFTDEEPALLNRHWIMHGRTMKQYDRLDCVKVLNMICGTIRMGQLGEQDES